MDAFSFVFSLFGLLMGLALTEAISGFGKAVELRHKVRIGWLSPLIALLITFDITSLWLIAWQNRSAIPIRSERWTPPSRPCLPRPSRSPGLSHPSHPTHPRHTSRPRCRAS